MRAKVFKFLIHLESGQVYCGTQNQDAAIFFYHLFPFFLFSISHSHVTGQSVHVWCVQELGCCSLFVPLLVHFSSPERKAYRWAYSIGSHPSSIHCGCRCQHFQKTSPLKPWSLFLPYFNYCIYRQGEQIMYFFCPRWIRTLVAMATSSCHWLIRGGNENWHLLQKSCQKFYRNVPWVVLYKTYLFCCNFLTWLVTMATKRQSLQKKI